MAEEYSVVCMCVCVCVYGIYVYYIYYIFIHSSVDGHVDGFHNIYFLQLSRII